MNNTSNLQQEDGFYGQQDLLTNEMNLLNRPIYAGFWLRVAAYLIDAIIFWMLLTVFGLSIGIGNLLMPNPENLGPLFWIPIGLIYLGILLYFPLMESSKWQATLGKRAVGIMVTDGQGNRLSFLRALGRNLGKILSALVIYVGFMMAGFTEKKQALHDMLSGALVIKGIKK